MSGLSFHQQAVLWGQAYEVFVKRGGIACLIEQGLLANDRPSLDAWRQHKLLKVSADLTAELSIDDPQQWPVVKAAVRHMALTAFGNGYTAMRAYLQSVREQLQSKYMSFNAEALKLKALWCPLAMPGSPGNSSETHAVARQQLYSEFGLHGIVDPAWSHKGQPANADFMLWLSYANKCDFLLVQEYSFDMARDFPGDFREQGPHLDELTRHRRVVDSRSVFARVAAQVEGERFELSDDVKNYLSALTSENKPFYKLCQASSYAERTVRLLQDQGLLPGACHARALAITPNGLESLAATFAREGENDTRIGLMTQMGAAYRGTQRVGDGDEAALEAQIEAAFNAVRNRLPAELKKGFTLLSGMPKPGEDYTFEFEESTKDFANPAQEFPLSEALDMVETSDALEDYFEGLPRDRIGAEMAIAAKDKSTLSLRAIHASAIVAGLRRAKRGCLNVLALEGNPGIGKTTAIKTYLSDNQAGYLFIYLSPRVVINRSVTHDMARVDGQPSGILTITTNSQLISAAERWHKKQVEMGLREPCKVEGAVVADGFPNLFVPPSSILVLTPEQEHDIDNEHAGTRLLKNMLSEHDELVVDRPFHGVLHTMAVTAKTLWDANPSVDKLVLTGALQGFRERADNKTTIDALSKLFLNKASTSAGRRERMHFAQRMPNILVMVDELAGDGAGAPFVHSVARWLTDEFVDSFEEGESPFTVTLVISDASLGNEVVLNQYLNGGERTPDKVLVSKSSGRQPFRIAVTPVRIGLRKRQTLHVMTNSFPATELHIRYRVKLTSVTMGLTPTGEPQTVRQAIREAADDAVLKSAVAEIMKALGQGARQVIFFAQDKLFLRTLRETLIEDEQAGLDDDNVRVLDSSVTAFEKKLLVQPEIRERVRVFLMTSSGARGVSFPITDWIIATIPRFNIEAALMEVAQLIYRGRGNYRDEFGKTVSGDNVPRHLVMLVNDYLLSDDGIDRRQWLRQSLDLMTLLVMLRSTILTRITGDAGLRQPLALVPVGAVGVEELVSLMSQHVCDFMSQARLYQRKGKDKDLQDLASRAMINVANIFSRTRLSGVARKGEDGRTFVKPDVARDFIQLASNSIQPLIPPVSAADRSLPEHVSFSGPTVVENWAKFDKQEMFSFEEHDAQLKEGLRQLKGQLYAIDQDRRFPSVFRIPAASLLKLLYREENGSAIEFRTLKALRSPNTWVCVPAGYYEFVFSEKAGDGRPFTLHDEEIWQEALARTLNAGSAMMPPLPQYETFPWGVSVGRLNPLNLDLVFDDRYFMASNELNLLNTLLLAQDASDDEAHDAEIAK